MDHLQTLPESVVAIIIRHVVRLVCEDETSKGLNNSLFSLRFTSKKLFGILNDSNMISIMQNSKALGKWVLIIKIIIKLIIKLLKLYLANNQL